MDGSDFAEFRDPSVPVSVSVSVLAPNADSLPHETPRICSHKDKEAQV